MIINSRNSSRKSKKESSRPLPLGLTQGQLFSSGGNDPVGVPNIILRGDDSALPPSTNRGGKLQGVCVVGIDWFQGTFVGSRFQEVIDLFEKWHPKSQRCDRSVPFRGLSNSVSWVNGAAVSWDPASSWGFIRLPGLYFQVVEKLSAEAFVFELSSSLVKTTRIDIFRDDYSKRIHPRELFLWSKLGLLRGKKIYGYYESFDGKNNGATFTCGSRGDNGCGSFVRYYDKSQCKKDRDDCYRLEVEFTGDKARKVVEILLESSGEGLERSAEKLESVSLGQFDFALCSIKEKSRNREVLPEWLAYCDSRDRLRITIPREPRRIESSIGAFLSQWSGFLCGLSVESLSVVRGLLDRALRFGIEKGFESYVAGSGSRVSRTIAIGREEGGLDRIVGWLSRGSDRSIALESIV